MERFTRKPKKILGPFPNDLAVSRYLPRGHDLKLLKTDTFFSTGARISSSFFFPLLLVFFFADCCAKLTKKNKRCDDR